MNDKAREIKNEYMRNYMAEYRAKNKEKLSNYQKCWRKENADKVRGYNEKYWENRSVE